MYMCHFHISHGNVDMVEELISLNASVNMKNDHQYTALMLASSAGHTEIVRALINAHAGINA